MKKSYIIPLCVFILLGVVALVLLTPYDYEITSNLYHKEIPVNQFLEVIGPAFMPFFMFYAVISLLMLLKFKKTYTKVLAYIGLCFSYIYAFFMGTFTFKHSYCSALFIPSIIVYVLFTIGVIYLNQKIIKKSNNVSMHIKICFVMFIVCATSLMITDIIKLVFSRVRYIELDGTNTYHPWYYITGLFNLNSSFPSGHVTRAGTALCFGLLPLYKNRKNMWMIVIESIALIFTILVGISRLFEGMHYACDILVGFILIVSSYYISKNLILIKNN